MKIVVIGGTGLIGKKVVALLRGRGHEVLPASPSSGVNAQTGEGLAGALAGADVVVDVANSPSFEAGPVMKFFAESGRNLTAAEKAAGVKHHVALSIVGIDRQRDNPYMAAKIEQERQIVASGVPFTIVRATQFFEFVSAITAGSTRGETVVLSDVYMQPIAADDVAAAVAEAALATPLNGTRDIAGPDKIRMDALGRQYLAARGDPKPVVTDRASGYFGATVDDTSLVPIDDAHLGATHFAAWLARA